MSTLENTFDFCVFCAKYLFGEALKYCYQYDENKIACGARCGKHRGGAPPLSVIHRSWSKSVKGAPCALCITLDRSWPAVVRIASLWSAGVGAQCPREPLRAGGNEGDRPARCKPRVAKPAKLHQRRIWRQFYHTRKLRQIETAFGGKFGAETPGRPATVLPPFRNALQ